MNLLTAARIKWHVPGTVKLVVDGNSIVAGGHDGADSVGGFMGYLGRSRAPFSWQTIANVAIGGQTTQDMINNRADVNAAFDPARVNILFAQEGTNQANLAASPPANCDKFLEYLDLMRAERGWSCIVVATAPMYYAGDHLSQAVTTAANNHLDEYNIELRRRWPGHADALIETRWPGGPYDQARYPDYTRARFFDTEVVNGASNNACWIDEPEGGAVPHQRIHPTALATRLHSVYVADQLLRLRLHRGFA